VEFWKAMSVPDDIFMEDGGEGHPPDPKQGQARDVVEKFFEDHPEQVFFSRQIEILHEGDFFHWVMNRAIRDLEATGRIMAEWRTLKTGGQIKLLWHKSYRYYKRGAADLVRLVEAYSDPNIGGALGRHGELMVLEGFAKNRFVMAGQSTREYREKRWTQTDHNLDFVFERDNRAYGVEVKNMLGYMDHDEFRVKISLCRELGIAPVFVARMLPKVWVHELVGQGGFALILKYQLYPLAHKDLAKRVAMELGLPVDSPARLADGTMARFVAWHQKSL
jgi:hypothetical protein